MSRFDLRYWGKFFWGAAVMSCIVPARIACAADDPRAGASRSETTISLAKSAMWAWTQWEWTEDKDGLEAARSSLDASVTSGNIDAVKDRLAEDYRKDPTSLNRFKWIYVNYLSIALAPVQDNLQLAKAFEELSSLKAYTYDESRLRFLYEAHGFPHPELIPLGRRLLQRDPSDYETTYFLVNVLDPSRSAEEEAQAIDLVKKLIELKPNRPNVYTAKGSTYYKTWLRTRLASDGEQSIAGYNRYLEISDKKEEFRKIAIGIVDEISQYMKAHSVAK